MKRTAVLVGAVLTLTVGMVTPALAQDLEDWLERARRAEYTGRQFTLCDTPDGRVVEIVEVTQRDGLLEVRGASGSAVVSEAGIYERSADGSMSVTSAQAETGWQLSDRYTVEFGDPGEVLNRPVDVLRIMEGDLLRMRLAFDRETGAVLLAEVHNGDETRYCTSSFLDFDAGAEQISHPEMVAAVIEPADDNQDRLPPGVAGFTLKDAYKGPSGSVTGFYSDGIFSFTLVAADRRINVKGLPTTTSSVIGKSTYERAFTPGQSVHSWEASSGGYVMLGDLPLDMQEAVLDELPEPGKASFLARFWRRLFW